MALAHNGIIRSLNAIWLQAPHLPRDDHTAITDFLTYCQCWAESMHHHHDAEEHTFFPSVEKLAGEKGLMSRNVEQHRAFTPGFEAFHAYVQTCKPGEFDGLEVRELVDAFAEPLTKHLREEIETLRALVKYDSERLREAYKRFEKELMATDNNRIAPLVFGTADRTFEGGMHDFPAVPFFVPYIIHYVFARRHRGAWRYNPSTLWRDPKELAFMGKVTAG
ncbi:hypothetical protein LTR53_005078 [Teratosphaeriaceae sp. CCFEE 6253]|nr:hypothetical protein LTR53_005078 [Teratosphaeriaceae sp. CCFEE 6253]